MAWGFVWVCLYNKDPGDDLLRVACCARNRNFYEAYKNKTPDLMVWGLSFIKTLAMTYSCMA